MAFHAIAEQRRPADSRQVFLLALFGANIDFVESKIAIETTGVFEDVRFTDNLLELTNYPHYIYLDIKYY